MPNAYALAVFAVHACRLPGLAPRIRRQRVGSCIGHHTPRTHSRVYYLVHGLVSLAEYLRCDLSHAVCAVHESPMLPRSPATVRCLECIHAGLLKCSPARIALCTRSVDRWAGEVCGGVRTLGAEVEAVCQRAEVVPTEVALRYRQDPFCVTSGSVWHRGKEKPLTFFGKRKAPTVKVRASDFSDSKPGHHQYIRELHRCHSNSSASVGTGIPHASSTAIFCCAPTV